MKLAIGSDERTNLTDEVVREVQNRGHDVILYGHLLDESLPWPEVGRQVAERVAQGKADEGILFCWTGTGVSLAANKVPGIRAALCADAETAKGARLWNKANILCISLRATSSTIAQEILDAWFDTVYQPNEEDDACLTQIASLEKKYLKQGD